MRNPLTCLSVLAGLYLAFLSLPALAQRPPADTFTDDIEVRVVNLEVVVTDGKGERVVGLRPGDFELRVDGKKMNIDYFTEIADGRSVASAGGTASAWGSGEAVPVSYLVFVDRQWAFLHDQERLFQRMGEQIANLRPGDRMAVVVFDGQRLERLTGWTDSKQVLEQAFQGALSGEYGGMDQFADEARFLSEAATRRRYEAEGGARGDPIKPFAENPDLQHRMRKLYHQMDLSTRAAVASMYGFASPRGRKVMLMAHGVWIPRFPEYLTDGRPDKLMRRVTEAANRLGFTLYAADVPMERFGIEAAHHEALDFLAEKTGGQSFKNSTGLNVLESAAEDTRSYYFLGFNAEMDGKRNEHRIEVEARCRGCKVRTRTEYHDLSRDEELGELAASAAVLGDLPGAEALGVHFGEPQAKSRRVEVPLILEIPLDAVTMVPGPEGHTARLEVRVAGFDESGGTNEISATPISFSGPQPTPGQHVVYELTLELRKESHDLVVTLLDMASGAVLVGRGQLEL